MKKLIGAILSIIILSATFMACDKETYTERLNKEKKAIEKFIRDNNIKVVDKFPDKFDDNVFFKDPDTGVYIHVISFGDEEKPSKNRRTDVYLRYDSIYDLIENDVIGYPNWTGSPMSFKFGVSTTYTSSTYYFLSQGCVVPLEYELGNNAEVKLIVPFESGSSMQTSSYSPYYYSRLKYSFVPDETEE